MKKLIVTLSLVVALSTNANASVDNYKLEIAESKHFNGEIELPPGFSQDDFALLDILVSRNPRLASYKFSKIDYVPGYKDGVDLILLYGAEIVVIEKKGSQLNIKSSSHKSDGLANSSKLYQADGNLYILQGLSDVKNFSEYRLLKLDGYNISQIGNDILTKGTDLPPAAHVSLQINPDNLLPQIVFLENQVWLELSGDGNFYKTNASGRVTLELQNGNWALVAGEKQQLAQAN